MPELDQEALYGEWLRGTRWRDRLHKQAAHKALNVPLEDDMIVDNSKRGMGWKELAVIVAGLMGTGGIAAAVLNQDPAPIVAPAPAPPATAEGAARVRVFWGDREIKPGESAGAKVGE